MEYAKNRSPINHEMSTKNRGTILGGGQRDRLMDPTGGYGGRAGRNAFEEPEEVVFGPHAPGSHHYGVGGEDPCDHNDGDGDFDGDPFMDYDHR